MADGVSDVWFRVTDLEVASGSGCVGHHHRRRPSTSTSRAASRSRAPATATRTWWRPSRRRRPGSSTPRSTCYRHTRLGRAGRPAGRDRAAAGIDTFFFANSGAEATEAAVKLAKQATGRPERDRVPGQLPRPHAPDHGDDDVEDRLPGRPRAAARPVCSWRRSRRPRTRSTRASTPCGSCCSARPPRRRRPPCSSSRCSARAATCPRPTAFLQGLEAICREHGILFVADEVQSGFGRTGTMFCVEQHGVPPDVVVMAKGLASGFPISAVGASAELMARWPTGQPRRHLRRQPDRLRGGHRHHRRAHRARVPRRACRRGASSCAPGCAPWPTRTAASPTSAAPA